MPEPTPMPDFLSQLVSSGGTVAVAKSEPDQSTSKTKQSAASRIFNGTPSPELASAQNEKPVDYRTPTDPFDRSGPVSEWQFKFSRRRTVVSKRNPSKYDTNAHRRPLWNPTEENLDLIFQLGELGWQSTDIWKALDITQQQFAGALIRCPEVKAAYEEGVASGAEMRALTAEGFSSLSWRPMPADLEAIRFFAGKGLGVAEIASKLHTSRAAIAQRLKDTPQVQEAYEQGNGEYRARLMETFQEMLETRSEDFKHMTGALLFSLRAWCGLTDKPAEKIEVEGTVNHNHQHRLNMPAPVAIPEIKNFADAEMARAKEISAERLRLSLVEPEAIDVKVRVLRTVSDNSSDDNTAAGVTE